MRCFLVCITVLFFSGRITGQTPELPAIYSFDYTKVIPGMPENASLGAYGNISLNTAKGLPDIHVDLYTISKGGVNIPISISYLASGIKYDDVPSSAGMHWQLNAGGSINRSVNGYADEDYLYENLNSLDPAKFNYQNSRINSHPTQDSCKFVAKNYYDFSLDYYFYNFPGHSGSMYPAKNKTFYADKEYSRLQIKAGTHLDNFTIKDDAGNTYVFGTYTDNSTVYNTGKYNKQASSSFYARVAWKLLTIITATQQRINFEYVPYSYDYWTLDSEKGVIYVNNGGHFDCPSGQTYNVGNNAASFQTTHYVNTASLLSKIYTDDQEVLFQYVTNTSVPVFQKKLSGIKVYSKISGDTVKNISLSFTGDYLDSVKETDKSALSVSKKYSFKYNSYYTPDSYSKSRDIFGYNNGMNANNSLMDNPAFKSYFPYAISNRDVNAYFASYGILNEITYPTGGKTTLTYESNKEDIGSTSYYSPGLRVKSLLEKDITNKIYNKKNFYYSQLQGGKTYADMKIVSDNQLDPNVLNVIYSGPQTPEWFDDFFYQKVVTENTGDSLTSKRFYEIDNYTIQYDLYDKHSPLLYKKQIFIDDTFHLQKSITTDYESVTIDSLTNYSFVLNKAIAVVGTYNYLNDPLYYSYCPPFTIYQGYQTRHILKPWLYNFKTITTREFSTLGDSLVSITNNFYNSNSSLLQKSEIVGSDNAINTTKYYYPQDYPLDNLLKRMKDSFIVAPVIKEQFLVNNVLKKEKENNYLSYPYGFFGVNNQLIRDVPTTKTQVLNYYGYNIKGHPLSTGPNREIITSYIWDYLNELPIAEITNADTLSVAYSSFESDGKGRWNFTGSPSPDVKAVTGKKVYLLSSGTITKTGLNSSLYYLLSYWTKTSALTIAGTQSGWPKLMASINIKGQNWSLYEHRITGQTTITLSGAFTIDELRLYPEKAQMVTYTYQPLVGITSQGDINGRLIYYEYDGMNRLVMVRDQNRNVLKKICYNYYGQKENCPQAVYWNTALSKVFKKNNCSTGYIGSSVTYSVPAGVHSSTISQDDANNFGTFDADGQNYANTTGTCTRIYYNVAKSGTFTRNNCNAGYTGSSELYYVAAATYSSFISQVDADGLAQNDVNANGQNYANTYGTCTIVCIHCTANNRKCINGVCEFGVKVYTSSTWDPSTGKYNCVYHYEFSDGSWSIDYTEVSSTSCIVG